MGQSKSGGDFCWVWGGLCFGFGLVFFFPLVLMYGSDRLDKLPLFFYLSFYLGFIYIVICFGIFQERVKNPLIEAKVSLIEAIELKVTQ